MWTEKHPIDGMNDRVFVTIASLFLDKAKQDRGHVDEYVRQAILYRDKAIPTASDTSLGWYSMATVQQLALISESAGDLSDSQRCVQYRNAIKLWDRTTFLLNEKRDHVARLFKPDPQEPTTEEIRCLSRKVEAREDRVKGKLQGAACQ